MKRIVGLGLSVACMLLCAGVAGAADLHSGYYRYDTASEVGTAQQERSASQQTVRSIATRIAQMVVQKAYRVGSNKSLTDASSLMEQYPLFASADEAQNAASDAAPTAGDQGGAANGGWGAWGQTSVSWLHDNSSPTRFGGETYAFMAGMDKSVSDKLILGSALGYSYSDFQTKYNYGGMWVNTARIAPYLAYTLYDNLVFTGVLSLAHSLNKTYREPNATVSYRANYASDSLMGSGSLNYHMDFGKFYTDVFTGYFYSNTETDSYTESGARIADNDVDSSRSWIGEYSAGMKVGYNFASSDIYASGAYLNDSMSPTRRIMDNDAVEASAGFDYFFSNGFVANFEAMTTFLRSHEYNSSLALYLRYNW